MWHFPTVGSANELSPPINPVWRIILFPSCGQTLSVMKWPQVLPCNPVPARPSNSACLMGKKGLQCGFNPTQPLLGFNGFLTSTQPIFTSLLPLLCSRSKFISCGTPPVPDPSALHGTLILPLFPPFLLFNLFSIFCSETRLKLRSIPH